MNENLQAVNPFLPSFEYIPDAEPHVFNDRVYIYGSHDRFNGVSFCLNDYVCWSAPIDGLSDWRYEGVIFSKKQDKKRGHGFLNSLYAPDVCLGADKRYYLYFFIGYTSRIGVAVCDTPCGKFEFYGYVKYADGILLGKKKEPIQFDPGVFVDDDGKIYLYTGFGALNYPKILLGGHDVTKKGAMGFELERDMLTIKGAMSYIGVPTKACSKDSSFCGHEFFEASSMRKFNGKYYFIYSSVLGHELCYAIGDSPLGGFEFGGTLVSIGDIGINGFSSPSNACNFTGNTHGSVVSIQGRYFVFYHRQTNRNQFSRQAAAQELQMDDCGKFAQAEVTSCGLNLKPLKGSGKYEARIACNLIPKQGNRFYGVLKGFKTEPHFTQYGKDRENNPNQYIKNVLDGTIIGFKYFEIDSLCEIEIEVQGKAKGEFNVSTSIGGEIAARIKILPSKDYRKFSAPINILSGKHALFFTFIGKGKLNFKSFTLK